MQTMSVQRGEVPILSPVGLPRLMESLRILTLLSMGLLDDGGLQSTDCVHPEPLG